jgi:hypothetical protein
MLAENTKSGEPWAERVRRSRSALLVASFVLAGCGESVPPEVDSGTDATVTADAATEPTCEELGNCPPPTCEALRASGACPAHRVCNDTVAGGMCTETCDEDFLFNESTGACDSCDIVDCGPPPTCEPNVEGSIAETCAAQHRECSFPDAACGACVEGFTFDASTSSCVVDCSFTMCDPGSHVTRVGDACECAVNECPPGQAERRGEVPFTCTGSGTAPACDLACDGEHVKGVYYLTTESYLCACETEQGWYWGANRTAEPCDEDEDGWMSQSAYSAYNSEDATISEIARAGCELSSVDRVVLENEYGQQHTTYFCGAGFSDTECPALPEGAARITLPLVEPDANDSQTLVGSSPIRVPSLPDGGNLRAEDLNAVTKACATPDADFDGNMVYDVAQSQTSSVVEFLPEHWSSVAYFTELHTSEYIPPMNAEVAGRFVIRERRRNVPEFPLGYAEGAGTYWRECSRQRDARYVEQASIAGFDFARWTNRGAPSVAVPPIPMPTAGSPQPPHGLSSMPAPWAGEWRGMTHHSQFKCVVVSNAPTAPSYSYPTSAFGPDGHLDYQECALDRSESGEVSFACTPQSARTNAQRASWASVRYKTTPIAAGQSLVSEVAGCVDETIWQESLLCPPDTRLDEDGTMMVWSKPDDFGRLICGCDPSGALRPVADKPGLASVFADANCDGVDGTATAMVFVALSGNDGSGNGTRQQPFRTINRGIQYAKTNGIPDVAVSAGAYNERVVLAGGVSIHGGYDAANGWSRAVANVTEIRGTTEGIYAADIDAVTVVNRFDVYGGTSTAPAGAGVSVYGVRIVHTVGAGSVELRNVRGTAGRGSNGSTGGNGGGGENDGTAATGANGRQGGGRGWRTCGTGDVVWDTVGGNGGWGGQDTEGATCNGWNHGGGGAASHAQPQCGRGGGGGDAAEGCGTDQAHDGGGGWWSCGGNGGTGPGASGIGTYGNIVSYGWNPRNGNANGGRGAHGMGGGGGGGGGSGNCDTICGGPDGGGGGGGGAGGCGGYPGGAGTGAGGSFGLFVVDANIVVLSSTFVSGAGGTGGNGGSGGGGSGGGAPGAGAGGGCPNGSWAVNPRCSSSGAGGAWGRNGGQGGGGGGGAGGPSVAQFICRSTAAGVSGATGQAGPGGGGGAGGGGGGPNGIGGYASAYYVRTSGDCAIP